MNNENIKGIAPFLQEEFIDVDCSDSNKKSYWELRSVVEKSNPVFAKYLWNNLHDSNIESIEKNNADLILKINDINAKTFSETLNNNATKDHKFLIELAFKNLKHFSINSVDDNGEMTEVNISSNAELELLYDQPIEISDNRISLAISVFVNSDEHSGAYLLMLISAERLCVVEKQIDLLKSIYPDRFDSIDYFDRKRNQLEYAGDQSICKEWIKESKAGNRVDCPTSNN